MPERKIKTLAQIKSIAKRLKAKGIKIAFTNGCFDLLHWGHVKYLQDARKSADILIVGVNSDASVRRIKGRGRPITSQLDRARIIGSLWCVDHVVIFSQDTPLELIKLVRPNILIKGADWKKSHIVGSKEIEEFGGRVLTIRLIKGRSTTNLIKRVLKKHKHIRTL